MAAVDDLSDNESLAGAALFRWSGVARAERPAPAGARLRHAFCRLVDAAAAGMAAIPAPRRPAMSTGLRWLLLAALSLFSLAATPGVQSPPGGHLGPSEGVSPAQQPKPPTCRPEVQADNGCRSGFRTVEVCYQGERVVAATVGQCVASLPVKPPKPPKVPK